MMKRLKVVFEIMDGDKDGRVDMEDRKRERDILTGVLSDLGLGPKTLDRVQEVLTLEQLKMEIEKEIAIVSKMQNLAAVELQRLVAECIPRGSAENPLQGLQDMSDEQLDHHLRMDVVPRVKRALANVKAGLPKVTTVKSETVTEHMPADHARVEKAVFGDLNDFENGIADKIGLPASHLMEGMEAEHCRRNDSEIKYETPGQSRTITTSAQEWAIVTDQSKGDAASVPPRRVLSVDCVMQDKIAVEAGLRQEEVIALMLYTGPMFYKYNAVLRGFPESVVESLGGNTYTTTIYCIVSGIKKLSKVMKLPEDRKVYRGVQGIDVHEFVSADACGVRGGVEFAMLSSSMDRSVAFRYAGKVMPILFEISVDGVDRGASVSFLSQYPDDNEILFSPLSYLEVLCSVPRIEATPEGVMVQTWECEVNANQNGSTIEDIEGRRKQLFLSSARNSVDEVKGFLEKGLTSPQVDSVLSHRGYDKQHNMHMRVAESIEKEADEWIEGYTQKEVEWFNNERQYAGALRELIALEMMAIGKFESWIEGTSGLTAEQLAKESIEQVSRRVRAEKKRQLDQAYQKEGVEGGESETVRKLALDLCRERGVVIQGVDDQNGMLLEPGVVSCGVEGDVVSLKLLLLAGCDVNKMARDESTALHAASVMGHLEYVRELVNGGADVFERNKTGETCLHLACQMGHSEVVRFLVEEYGKDLCIAETTSGATCALLACRNGRMEALRCIGKAGGRDLLMKVAKNGASCAASAAGQGRLEVLEYLVEECGPEILELVTDQGMSCAYLASQNGHLECVRFLAVKGGKELLMKVTKHGVSCAHRACEQGHLAVLEFLVQQCGRQILQLRKPGDTAGRPTSCFELAEANNHKEVLEYISKKLEHE
uniref:NAD(P)(+)--arginine ADP-ribosyltransferase n=1 Tax=Hemiselmis tepida TaxID=464990 RepID=A0A7S0YY27_9CRYP